MVEEMNKYYKIRPCDYPEEKRRDLGMKEHEVYKLKGFHWEYLAAFDTVEEAQEYINEEILK